MKKTMPNGTVVTIQFDNPGRGTLQITTVYTKESTSSMVTDNSATRTPKATEPVLSNTNVAQSGAGVNNGVTADESPGIYTAFMQRHAADVQGRLSVPAGKNGTYKMLYTEEVLKREKEAGNIYTHFLRKAEVEKARKIADMLGAKKTYPINAKIYADFIRRHGSDALQQDVGSEFYEMKQTRNHTEIERQFGILYGKDAAKVDFEYINSDTHKEKFSRISQSHKTNKSIYDISRTILQHCDGTEHEDLYLLSMDGEVIAKVTESDSKLGIIYSDDFKNALTDVGKNNTPVIAIHNHPHGTPPSPDDFRKAFDNKYSIGIIAGHNGQIYIYSNTTVELTLEQTEEIADDIEMLYRLGWDIDRASKFIYDAYGLNYTIIKGAD